MVRETFLYIKNVNQDSRFDIFQPIETSNGWINYSKLSLDPQDYPQIASLILGFYQQPSPWHHYWPAYLRAHFNNQSCLQLLATGVRLLLTQFNDQRDLWLRPVNNQLLKIGCPNRFTGLIALKMSKDMLFRLRDNATRGNNLRLDRTSPMLGVPYVFGMMTYQDNEYVITEAFEGPNLYQVLERPGIYQDDLVGILMYLRSIFYDRHFYQFHTPLHLIYLRPIPIGCDYIIGPSDSGGLRYFKTRYVPVFYYFRRDKSADTASFRADLKFVAPKYSYIFKPTHHPKYQDSPPSPAKRVYTLTNSDITRKSRWYQQAGQNIDPTAKLTCS
jgi:hypothetical protein